MSKTKKIIITLLLIFLVVTSIVTNVFAANYNSFKSFKDDIDKGIDVSDSSVMIEYNDLVNYDDLFCIEKRRHVKEPGLQV